MQHMFNSTEYVSGAFKWASQRLPANPSTLGPLVPPHPSCLWEAMVYRRSGYEDVSAEKVSCFT